jgi:hypothetical protein
MKNHRICVEHHGAIAHEELQELRSRLEVVNRLITILEYFSRRSGTLQIG